MHALVILLTSSLVVVSNDQIKFNADPSLVLPFLSDETIENYAMNAIEDDGKERQTADR